MWFLFFLALALPVAVSSPTGTTNTRWAQSQTATLHSTPPSCRLSPAADNAPKIWQQGERGLIVHRHMARVRQPPFISPKDNWKVKWRHLCCFPAVLRFLLSWEKNRICWWQWRVGIFCWPTNFSLKSSATKQVSMGHKKQIRGCTYHCKWEF